MTPGRWIAWLVPAFVLAAAPAPAADPLETPNVRRLGRTVTQWRSDDLLVVVGWKYAHLNVRERWIFLEVWMMPKGYESLEVNREDVALLAPDGKRLGLPSQRRLAEGLPDIRRVLNVADVTRDPMEGYFSARRSLKRIGFHEIPATRLTYEFVGMAPFSAAFGDLFFEAPDGKAFVPGIYTLALENRQMKVRIPLPLGIEGELERVK